MKLLFGMSLAFVVGVLLLTVLLLAWPRQPLVSINLMNRAGGACDPAEIEINGKRYPLKADVANGNASITGGWPYPMPATATLRWRTENKIDYSTTIEMPRAPAGRTRVLNYDIVILPEGRAKALVRAWDKRTEDDVQRQSEARDELCRDGGPDYGVVVKNLTGFDVDRLDVRFGPYAVNTGPHLSARGQNSSGRGSLPYPITSSTSVRWVTSDGRAWERVVDLPAAPSGDYNDSSFWFLLSPEGKVEVRLLRGADLRAGKHPELTGA